MYKNKRIIKDENEQKQILRKCHDDKMTRHSDTREILRKIKEVTFQNNIIRDTTKHVQECLSCQKERSNKKLNIK